MNFRKFRLSGAKSNLYEIVKNSTELSPEVLNHLMHAVGYIDKALNIWPTSLKED